MRWFAILLLVVAACAPLVPRRAATPVQPGVVGSNVAFEDYAGSKACVKCHETEAASWAKSPMHNMTREAHHAEVKGPFDGTEFRFHGDIAKLESAGRDRFITLDSKKYGKSIYKVTRIIGGHHREDYAGVPVASASAGARAIGDTTEERVLPVSFLVDAKTLRYKGYSVMVKERDGLKVGGVWNQTCIFCHNTEPYLSTVLGGLAGTSGYQGEVVDPLLPAAMRASYVVTDKAKLTKMLEAETKRLGGAGSTLEEAIATTRHRFRASHLVEVGIGCESCHLGSAEHVKDTSKRPSLEPISDAFAVKLPQANDEAKHVAALNRVCARCHQVLFTGYEHTWEGGSRKSNPGGSNINSGEARDMMLGACTSKLGCVHCHNPHAPDATASLRSMPASREDGLCTSCHKELAEPAAQKAHTHHDPAGAGGRCLSCHMPRKNMALDGTLSRYHRIGSPNDPAKVLRDRPIECALCHADKTAGELVATMESWWKKPLERGAIEKLYGSLDANVLLATAERGKPHEQAVAFQILGEAKRKDAVPVLAGQLTHPYPIIRGYAKRALDAIYGAPVDVDIDAEDDVIAQQAKKLR